MYDMYPWDSASQGDYPPEPLRSRRDADPKTPPPAKPTVPASPARAVQVALDRRDNGGEVEAAARMPIAGRTGQ
jgi:hypothetical protein